MSLLTPLLFPRLRYQRPQLPGWKYCSAIHWHRLWPSSCVRVLIHWRRLWPSIHLVLVEVDPTIDPPAMLCESAQLHIDTVSDPQAVWECSAIFDTDSDRQSILSLLTLMLLLTLFLSGACHQQAGCSATTYIGKLWPQSVHPVL